MSNPTFGEKLDNVDYKARYGVYAIIPNATKDQIILVQAPFFQVEKSKRARIIFQL